MNSYAPLISKCLARAHCLKLATKHHRHRLIRSGLKIQMLFFVLSDIFFLLGQTRKRLWVRYIFSSWADKKKIMGQKKKIFGRPILPYTLVLSFGVLILPLNWLSVDLFCRPHSQKGFSPPNVFCTSPCRIQMLPYVA